MSLRLYGPLRSTNIQKLRGAILMKSTVYIYINIYIYIFIYIYIYIYRNCNRNEGSVEVVIDEHSNSLKLPGLI